MRIQKIKNEIERKKNRLLDHLCKERQISEKLEKKLKNFLNKHWKNKRQRIFDINFFMNSLNSAIKLEFLHDMYFPNLKNISFFSKNFSLQFIESIAESFREYTFIPDDKIIKALYSRLLLGRNLRRLQCLLHFKWKN